MALAGSRISPGVRQHRQPPWDVNEEADLRFWVGILLSRWSTRKGPFTPVDHLAVSTLTVEACSRSCGQLLPRTAGRRPALEPSLALHSSAVFGINVSRWVARRAPPMIFLHLRAHGPSGTGHALRGRQTPGVPPVWGEGRRPPVERRSPRLKTGPRRAARKIQP